MSFLCETVKVEIFKSFEGHPVTSWEFVPNGPESCTVISPQFIIKFFVDGRDKSISSSIVFRNLPENEQEELYSHIICKLFPKLHWQVVNEGGDPQRLRVEVDNIKRLLDVVADHDLTGRDLLYFYLGYNSAYTDSMSSN